VRARGMRAPARDGWRRGGSGGLDMAVDEGAEGEDDVGDDEGTL
jgi:hypothetical protein